MLVLPAVRQRVGIPERLHFLLAHPLTTGGYRAGCEQPHRENELTRPDVVDGDVLPDHLGDVGVDLHPAVLAVLGVLPGQEPVPGRVEVRGHLDRGLADGEHAAAEVEVLGGERDQLAVSRTGRYPEPGEDLGRLVWQRRVDPLELRDSRDHDRPGGWVLEPDPLYWVVVAVAVVPRHLHHGREAGPDIHDRALTGTLLGQHHGE